MMLKGKKEFVAALFVIVSVLLTLALPYALIETYGLKAKKLILLMQLVFLAVFSVGMLIWWVVRHRQTSQDIEKLRKEIKRKLPDRNECEHRSRARVTANVRTTQAARTSFMHAYALVK